MSGQHEPCPDCGSKDNLYRWDNGQAYCFGCERFEPSPYEGQDTQTKERIKTEFTPLFGECRSLKKRKIHQATCEKFGYRIARFKHQNVQVCDVRNEQGVLVAQKVRTKDKRFFSLGSLDSKPLIGMHLFKRATKKLIICEGEIDMLSWSQVQGNKYPVVSLPNGAQSAVKVISENMEYLSLFEEILLSFDMDEPGQKAAREVASLLTDRCVKIIELPLKDANEMLVADRIEEMITAFWNAKPFRPEGLVSVQELKERVLTPPEQGLDWCFPGLTEATFGRRFGEVYFIGAGTGIGKTDFMTQQIAFDIGELKQPVGVFFLEQAPTETAKRILGKIHHKTFHVADGSWQHDELEKAFDAFQQDSKLTLYDSFGVTEWSSIREKILYLQANGTKVFYIDHLTALATGEGKDEKTALEAITADMAKLAERYGLILHVVSHLTAPQMGKTHEEGGHVAIRHFKGSRAIGYWAHFMFGLERNQQAENEADRQITTFRILKDRFTGRSTGQTFNLMYHQNTGLLEEYNVFDEEPDYHSIEEDNDDNF